MMTAIKYRIYPNATQRDLIKRHIAGSRLICNLVIDYRKSLWEMMNKSEDLKKRIYEEKLQSFDSISSQITQLKRTPEGAWLNDLIPQSLGLAGRDTNKAYDNFIKGNKGFPKYKGVKNYNSFRFYRCEVKVKGSRIYLLKLGWVKLSEHKVVDPKVWHAVNMSISVTPTGKYFLAIALEMIDGTVEKAIAVEKLSKTKPVVRENAVGIDMGIRQFMVLSDGTSVDTPDIFRRNDELLVKLSKELSKKPRGQRKTIIKKINKVHEKMNNQRHAIIHNVTKKIVDKYDTIFIENLDIKGMKDHNSDESSKGTEKGRKVQKQFNKSMREVPWHQVKIALGYKAAKQAKNFHTIDRYAPTSKICSHCGFKNDELKTEKKWVCPSCNTTLDRDANASYNVLNFGLNEFGTEEKGAIGYVNDFYTQKKKIEADIKREARKEARVQSKKLRVVDESYDMEIIERIKPKTLDVSLFDAPTPKPRGRRKIGVNVASVNGTNSESMNVAKAVSDKPVTRKPRKNSGEEAVKIDE